MGGYKRNLVYLVEQRQKKHVQPPASPSSSSDSVSGSKDKSAPGLTMPSPSALRQQIPKTAVPSQTVLAGRRAAKDIVSGCDRLGRLLVVVGPCSIHNPQQALQYCDRLLEAQREHKNELLIVMRCYLEKPRTITGWKGFLIDPDLDDSCDFVKGLTAGRALLLDIAARGMPVATELLSIVAAKYLDDLVSVGFIGARTTESQLHRELASSCDFPVGFKNGTDGSLTPAVNAVRAAAAAHQYLSLDDAGHASVAEGKGNNDCFVVLRGGTGGTNYDVQSTTAAEAMLAEVQRHPAVMIDCSHGNARGNHKNQVRVAEALAEQIASGRRGIMGVMLESHINEGKQPFTGRGIEGLQYGVSLTDACISWESTTAVFDILAEAIKERRSRLSLAF